MMRPDERRPVRRYKDGCFHDGDDLLAVEARMHLSVNGTHVMSIACTPLMVRELAVGVLMTEGIAEGICTERMTIVYKDNGIAVDVHAEGPVRTEGATKTSGCVGGVMFKKPLGCSAASDPLRIEASALRELFSAFQRRSELYEATGCVHSAAMAEPGGIIRFAEDIGRHNAVDKLIGAAILDNEPFAGRIMLASGRLSAEIVSKCARWGIPIVASRTAATSLAARMAEEQGITLVGFLRGGRFTIYSRPDRIINSGC